MAKNIIEPYTSNKKLTKKQELWIEEYLKCNDYTTASRNAGYKGNENSLKHIGYENSIRLKEVISKRQKEITEKIKSQTIAELEDIYEFWTKTFTDPNEYMKNRIKASELLAKAKGGFVEKVEVKKVDTDWFIEDSDE